MKTTFAIVCPDCDSDSVKMTLCVPPDPLRPNGATCNKCGYHGMPDEFFEPLDDEPRHET
jgi:hypothetical protein